MPIQDFPVRQSLRVALAAGAAFSMAFCNAARAESVGIGNLFVISSTYAGNSGTVAVGQALPNSKGVAAVADGTYPNVFSNDAVDGNFGVTAPIALTSFLSLATDDDILVGPVGNIIDVTQRTGIVTSFSSKSELAVNLSTGGSSLTLMGYDAPVNALDVSNADTPNHVDPTNTDTDKPFARAVVQIELGGDATRTDVDAYSGNNGRAAILIDGAHPAYVMVGNAGNGSGLEPFSIVSDTGVQAITPNSVNPGTTVVGAPQGTYGNEDGFQFGFAIQSLGYPADKSGKDDNFRGLAEFDGHIFTTKGSGSNGVDTVYQVSVPGNASIQAGASVAGIGILPGFPTMPASGTSTFFPFGIWFANATTLYVADEGEQSLAADPNAGLQKWLFDGSKWHLAYVLQNGLKLDQTTSVPSYPQMDAPATTGLRNISGHVQGNTATIFAATATFSALADPGADPNSVVEITDQLDATTAPQHASFRTILPAQAGRVYRGVAYVPCDSVTQCIADNRIVTR